MNREVYKKELNKEIDEVNLKLEENRLEAIKLEKTKTDLNELLESSKYLIFPAEKVRSSGGRDEHYLYSVTIEGIGSAEQWDRKPKFDLNLEQAEKFITDENNYHQTVYNYLSNKTIALINAVRLVEKSR